MVRHPILQLFPAGILGCWSIIEGIVLYGLMKKMVTKEMQKIEEELGRNRFHPCLHSFWDFYQVSLWPRGMGIVT